MSDANSTVLVIDDDPSLRASVGRLLQSLGLDVVIRVHSRHFLGSGCVVAFSRKPVSQVQRS